jgi:hypothetical protein
VFGKKLDDVQNKLLHCPHLGDRLLLSEYLCDNLTQI